MRSIILLMINLSSALDLMKVCADFPNVNDTGAIKSLSSYCCLPKPAQCFVFIDDSQ